MPKRKHHEDSNVAKKLRKIEKMLKKCKKRRLRIISSSSDSSSQSLHKLEDGKNQSSSKDDAEVDSILFQYEPQQQENVTTRPPSSSSLPPPPPQEPTLLPSQEVQTRPEEDTTHLSECCFQELELDNDIQDILGDDPSNEIKYGKDIRPELAARFNHIATNGLNRDTRKETCEKYTIPGNCTMIGAPVLNAEVKAALNETTLKRDKLIEARQKRIASAISCLGEAISYALESKEIDKAQIKRLMDTARLLCDAQFNDSVSRRNLAVFSLKKEMKEPLLNTKIDNSLFGEHLTEVLKSAKAVTKSVTELKPQQRPQTKNWKPSFAGRRQTATGRRNAPAAPTTPAQPPPPLTAEPRTARAHSSRKPPPPPPKSVRRRY